MIAFRGPARLSIWLACLCGCLSAVRADYRARPASCRVIEEYDVGRDPEVLLVPVTVEGERMWFVVDTGCATSVLDLTFLPLLGAPVGEARTPTAARDISVKLYAPPNALLGGVSLKEAGPVMCLDLGMFWCIAGRPIAGIIGMGLLRKYVLQLDSDNGKLRLLAPVAGVQNEWGAPLGLFYGIGGLPCVRGCISGTEVTFIVDTGANNSGDLDAGLFDRFVGGAEASTTGALVETAAGTSRTIKGRLPSLSLGGHVYRDLLFLKGTKTTLGLGFLSRHCVTLDFPNRRMYLRKGKLFERSDESDMSGLSLLRIAGRTVVYAVEEGASSEEAGIKAKDVVLSVNGARADDLDMSKIRRILRSGDGKQIKMTIKRGEKVLDVSFRLKRRL